MERKQQQVASLSLLTKDHIDQLVTSPQNSELNNVTSIHWISNKLLAVGFEDSSIKIIDVNTQQTANKLNYHSERVSTINSTWDLLSSSGRDNFIVNHDLREKNQNIVSIFDNHSQEVCGLRWQPNTQTLASGANDNQVLLWDKRQMILRKSCLGHTAAIKAMCWCPWQQNILATGGGTNDKTIKFWNSDTGECTRSTNTGSQVCAIVFKQKEKQLISSHGFSKFQISLWKTENFTQQPLLIQELHGHQSRVLHLGISPDESSLCSAAGDETLRFWRLNEEQMKKDESGKKLLCSKGLQLR